MHLGEKAVAASRPCRPGGMPAAEAVGADFVDDVAAAAAGVVFEEDVTCPVASGASLAVPRVADRGQLRVDRVGEGAAVDAKHQGGAEGQHGKQRDEQEGGRGACNENRLLASPHDRGASHY